MKLLIKDIIIGPRQRIDLGDLTPLKESLITLGQIQAIGVNEKNVLIWGRRRLAAATELNWTEIEAVRRENLSPIEEQLIEWEEDSNRKQRDFKESCIALAKIYNDIKSSKLINGENWTYKQMEAFTGIGSPAKIGYMLAVAEELIAFPNGPVKDATNLREAVQIVAQKRLKEANDELERRRKVVPAATPVYNEDEDLGNPDNILQFIEATKSEQPSHSTVKPDIRILAFKDRDEVNALLSISYECGFCLPDKVIKMVTFSRAGYRESFSNLMTFPIIWYNPSDSLSYQWPFKMDCVMGWLSYSNKDAITKIEHPSSSLIIAPTDDYRNDLPMAVIEHVCSALTDFGDTVVCCGKVDPRMVAELGRVPIIFEPDDEVRGKRVQELKAYYEETVKGCRVVI